MGIRPSKETLISREIDSHNQKQAATRTPRLLCLGEPLPPVSSSLVCDFVYIKQQRSQKWLQLLAAAEDTTQAIVFTVPLIWYEEPVEEGTKRSNKLQNAMEYFRVIRRNLRNRSMIVILTHRPEFAARIRGGEVDFVDHFPHYQGPPEDPAAALHFVRNEFKRQFYESSKACDNWANLFILYDDGCKQLRSTFLAQAIDAIRKTDSFAHIEDMLTPCHGVKVSSTAVQAAKSTKRREETRTVPLSSQESSSESMDRI
jgi:hypothetical protein